MTPYAEMALNNAYANRTLYGAIAGLDRAAFSAPRPGFFPSIAATLNHIYEVDLFYIDALEEGGLGRSVYDRDDVLEVAELARLQAASDLRLARFCAGEIDLDRVVDVERKGLMSREKIGALLPHLFQHQVHHRGQAHVQIGEAGIAPPQLDDFFLDHGRAPIAQEYFP
ncbi:MAG: DinB family protein [Silicimonas sp.]|nr:DinB family protein [Silicimonas sp.]